MRKEYSKELQSAFAKLISEHFPQFKPYKEKSIYYFAGERFFCWQPNDEISFFIIYSPDDRGHEAFTVEIGWSESKGLPELSMRPSFTPSQSRSEFESSDAITRLPYFFGDNDYYFIEPATTEFSIESLINQQKKKSPEEVEKKLAPILKDVLTHLKEAGVPYLEEKLRA